MNNYIKQKLEEFDSISIDRWAAMCRVMDSRLIENSGVYKKQREFLEQALKDYARKVLKEAEIELPEELTPWDDPIGKEIAYVDGQRSAIFEQHQRHQQILDNL